MYSLYDVDREEEGNVKPVTQTIKTDPVTGQQTMTISGSPQDLSAANPFTPTVSGPGLQVAGPVPPGAMEEISDEASKRRQRTSMAAAAAAGMPQMAAAAQPMAAGAGLRPPPMRMAGIPGGASAVTRTAQTFGSGADATAWMNDITNIQSDPNALAAYVVNNSNNPQGRNLARSLLQQSFQSQKSQQEAQQKVDRAIESGNMLEIARETQKGGDEGSYIKAYLYNRLGLTKLAQDEQEKLSPTFKWERVRTNDNKPALIKVDRRGLPVEGYTADGRMNDKQLINIRSSKGLDIVGGTYVNDRTGQVGRVVTDKETGDSYIQTDTGPVGIAGFRPQSTAGGLQDMANRQYQEARIKFETEPSIATATEYLKFARTVDPGDGSMIRAAQEQISRLPFGQQVLRGVGTVPGTVPAAPDAAPAISYALVPAAAQPAPVTPEMVPGAAMPAAQPQTMAQVAPTAQPVRPAVPVTGEPAVGATPVVPTAPTAAAIPRPSTQIRLGESQVVYQERIKREAAAYESALRQAEAQQRAGLDVGVAQQRANIEVGQQQQIRSQQSIEANRKQAGKLEQNARTVLSTIDQLLKHPGFNDVIGVKESIGAYIQFLPGDARDFRALYDQLNGQTFITAYEELKGGGSITEAEGIKAEQAISALRDPGINEKEWKRNAQTFVDVTKRGVDVARIRGNLEPKYKPFNDKEREAFNFILANPNDPRVPRIRNILENR
jgi:hypothetical protein